MKPVSCPSCLTRDSFEMIIEDGKKKHYQCSKCDYLVVVELVAEERRFKSLWEWVLFGFKKSERLREKL